jgi:hypothetical protein
MSAGFNFGKVLVVSLLTAAALQPKAEAGWWIFGKSSGRPEIMKVFVGGVDLSGAENKFALFRENLQDGNLVVKAFFRPASKAPVAQARVSVDGGTTWQEKVTLDGDSLTLSFTPQEGKSYELRMTVTDTKGQENDPGDVPRVQFSYSRESAESVAKRDLLELAKLYAVRDLRGFVSRIAADYRGDRSSLEDALAGDFKTYRQIDMAVTPQLVLISGPEAKIRFRYNMSAVSAADGSVKNASGETELTLRSENGSFKLAGMQYPLIFGSTARSDENPAAGGVPVDTNSGSTLSGALLPGVVTGNADVTQTSGFRFGTRSNAAPAPGSVDVGVNFGGLGPYLLAYSGGSFGYILNLGYMDLSSVSAITDIGHMSESQAVNGNTYAVLTESGKYAVMQITAINTGASTISFRYMYQPSGSPRFR